MKRDLFCDLIMTSADDCRVSLLYCNDTGALQNVLADLDRRGMEKKTHRLAIKRRIRKLEKLADPRACTGKCSSPRPSCSRGKQSRKG